MPQLESAVTMAKLREGWPDSAKGIAIVLVVFFHAVLFLGDIGLDGGWKSLNTALDSFRMPLFFFTAGIFAAKALQLSLRSLFQAKMLRMLWLYGLWSLIWALAFQVIPWVRENQEAPALSDWVLIWIWPNTSTWFVYAIALYFFSAWVLRKLPVLWQMSLAVVVSVCVGADLIHTGNTALDKMGTYFVFFLAAVHLGPGVRKLAPLVRRWQGIAFFAVYVVIAYAVTEAGMVAVPGVRLLLSCFALAAGLSLAVALSKWRAFKLLRWLGARTLTIYLLHFYPVLLAAALLAPVSDNEGLQSVAFILPPALTVLAILISLPLGHLGGRVPGLFSLPTGWRTGRPQMEPESRPAP